MPGFKPGQSGNPKGRPKGSTNKTIEGRKKIDAILHVNSQKLMRLAVKQAATEPAVLIALMERIYPKLRPKAEAQVLPIDPNGTSAEQRTALIGAMARGDLAIDDAATAINALKLTDQTGGIFSIQLVFGQQPPLPLAQVLEAHTPAQLEGSK